MKKTHALAAFLALVLAVTVSLPGAWAYFTANVRAGGGRTVQLQNQTEITEEFADWNKQITITAASGTQPVYVRARAYSTYGLTYTGEGWQRRDADGWYYYQTPLANPSEAQGAAPAWAQPGAAPLNVHITVEGAQQGETPEDFDVIVVYETTPVTYNADSSRVSPEASDWNAQLQTNGGAAQ